MDDAPSRATGPIDRTGDAITADAVALVHRWLEQASASRDRGERRTDEQFRQLTGDPSSVAFTMAFADRVVRPESDAVAATQLRHLVTGPLPTFLSPIDRLLLRAGATLARPLPHVAMPLARRRLRAIVGNLVVDRNDATLGRHLDHLRSDGFSVNANLLGELVLGDEEATRRRRSTVELLARDDIRYVSVKASSVTAQLSLWGYEETLARVIANLREVFAAAASAGSNRFVNLDMEEFKDLRLTIDAFTTLLDEEAFRSTEAGIVLQAYLPDSFGALEELTAWARRRRAAGGAGIKVRIVKGANLAMERVDAAMHGWVQAPYATKAETDANYKRMIDASFDPARTDAVRIGLASHNLFDVAWAHLLADARGVADRVQFEMLQGMAPSLARTVRDVAGDLLLYTPVVAAADFSSALAYLFRRLEENSSGDNFLRHLFELGDDPAAFAEQQRRFEAAVNDRWHVSAVSRRHHLPARPEDDTPFANAADTDPTDPVARAAVLAALADPPRVALPPESDVTGVDEAVATAVTGGRRWRALGTAERQRLLRRAADELEARRPELMAVMAHEAGKTLVEGDGEVSEAVDFARWYAERAADLDRGDGATFDPLGVIAVVPPWNFPMAIPSGGALAALAAGNAAILKPAPQTPACALAVAEACWAAGVPRDALQYLRVADGDVGSHLIAHPDVDGIILTGSSETAELFRQLAPETALFAETSGKNAMVILPDADLDLAVSDLVRSAFGHAGQKCSAASLAICVGDVATSERFRRQLIDATRSLVVAPATDPASAVGALVEPPSPKLARALTEPGPGESWLVEPRQVDAATNLWSPGILDGVAAGSWFHRTECFGPVLGLMAAADLDEAIALQNGTAFGLTGGLHTLDPANVERWLAGVEVGNAYVNRAITGAIVQRQPFGGWKGSVVGPGAKAGGPNYLAQLGRWTDGGSPTRGAEPLPEVAAVVDAFAPLVDEHERAHLQAAARSDAHWWAGEFSAEHDPAALFCEANVLRYRPLPHLVIRVAADAPIADVARVLVAATLVAVAGRSTVDLSVDPAHPGAADLPRPIAGRVESAEQFVDRQGVAAPVRVRLVGTEPGTASAFPLSTHVDDRPPVGDGRVELLHLVREQAVSRTLHRFGNLIGDEGR